jgi:hypothetical protein
LRCLFKAAPRGKFEVGGVAIGFTMLPEFAGLPEGHRISG